MTSKERKKLIDTLDVWVKECEVFYDSFKDDFSERHDSIKELEYRCLQVITITEFLFSGQFITAEKYLEIFDKLEKLEVKK